MPPSPKTKKPKNVTKKSQRDPAGRPVGGTRVAHGVELACYNNLPRQHPMIICLCGVSLEGPDWESVGADFDVHLVEAADEGEA